MARFDQCRAACRSTCAAHFGALAAALLLVPDPALAQWYDDDYWSSHYRSWRELDELIVEIAG